MDAEFLLQVGRRHRLILATKRTAYKMAETFGLQRLHDYLLRSSSLSSQPVWLMGVCFKNAFIRLEDELDEKVLAALIRHFKSLMYLSYRYNFSPKGLGDWTSDIGWGCTIRSGQMMMAQALLDHLKDQQFRKDHNGHVHSEDIASVVKLFWDSSSPEHVFSIHHICQAALKYGVGPGCWMGPGFVCRLLSEINNAKHLFGLHVALLSHPDGAPFLTPSKIDELMTVFEMDTEGETEARQDSEGTSSKPGTESKAEKEDAEQINKKSSQRKKTPGLVLLIPLVLGMSKIDSRYLKQLKQILTWPQSIGFIGGRSNSSLYFVGYQEDNLLYLDPHKPQAVAAHPTEMTSYFNSPLKHMHVSSLITSLSIGFYCKSPDELQDLMTKLCDLEKNSEGAPIISFINDGIVGEMKDLCVSESSSSADELNDDSSDE